MCCSGQQLTADSRNLRKVIGPRLGPNDVTKLSLPDVRITSVVCRCQLSKTNAEPGSKPIAAPHVEVCGIIGGTIGFELLLPNEWNGRIVMGGGGGFVGNCQHHGRSSVARGYATVGTDTGHLSATPFTADWALNDVEAQINFGYLAVHRTIEVAKAIVAAYYAKQAQFSYFMGCSNGGRQALMEAQRYPKDFDGIVSAAPAVSMTGEMVTLVHYAQYFFPTPSKFEAISLSEDDLKRLQQEVINQCDEQDGVKDGILDDPRRCRFDLSKLTWLTPKQRELIQAVYDGPQSNNVSIHPGVPLGSEADWREWFAGRSLQLPEGNLAPSMSFLFGTHFCKYIVFGDANWDYSAYDLANWTRDSRLVASFLNASNTDLSRFRGAGGKLILWHGWSDGMATALTSVQYFEDVEKRDPQVREFFRLFMLPGVLHCGRGTGPDQVDWLATIVGWVERERTPYRIVASKLDDDGNVIMTRPLYPYPLRAVYKGSGNKYEAANFAVAAENDM
jgi:feruloyl esterase